MKVVGILLFACCALMGCQPASEPTPAPDPEFVELTDDETVVRWRGEDDSYPGSFWDYRIAADGRFIAVHDERRRGLRASGQALGSVADLLADLQALSVFSIEEEEVWQQVRTRPDQSMHGPHAGPTQIWVRAGGQATTLRFRTIRLWAEMLPEAGEVQRAAAVFERIETFIDEKCRRWKVR